MTPGRRCEGLAAAARCRRDALVALAEAVAARAAVRVVEAPSPAVVNLRLTTAVGGMCLADAVVTTASVDAAGRIGWACVLGWDDRGALAAAICDAAGGAEAAALARDALAAERHAAETMEAEVAATRVVLG